MRLWVDTIAKLGNIPFFEIISFFFALELYEHDSRNLSYYNVHSVTKDNSFFDFPVNIWVASFMVYAFHGSTLLQSGI